MAEIGRILAVLVTGAVYTLLAVAVLKAAARLVRLLWRRVRSWRDLRTLQQYESEVWPTAEQEQIRGES